MKKVFKSPNLSERTQCYWTNFFSDVIFTASLSTAKDYGTGETIVYDNVLLNVGNAYNQTNGKFTAPYTGTFVLSIHINK